MEKTILPGRLRKFEIPGQIAFASGNGGLPKINITTARSTAEIYLHGAHITAFHKNGEPPLLFMGRLSHFAAGKAIRGGVPICFPWFGQREGDVMHGFARITEWELMETAAAPDGGVTVRFRLPVAAARAAWPAFRAELVVTVTDQLAMELIATNESRDRNFDFENCLHTYFAVGDIAQVSLTGLQGAPFDDFAAGAGGTRKVENDSVLRIMKETNRAYLDTTSTVEIHDQKFQRTIRVDKFNSRSTVVWNPWTTQKMPDDFDPAEHQHMVCVESGNVKQNKISLPPGKTAALKAVLSSRPR
ncbi:MAG: D-hexose-6-phosphate mutarotase [Verrucomicrobiota bacterium]|jgi:D-hexose-6-phosphate mutarotase